MGKFVQKSCNGCQWFVCEKYRDGYYILGVFYSKEKAEEKLKRITFKGEIDE